MPNPNRPKILVEVHDSGLVKVRSTTRASVAVVNLPRLKKLKQLDPSAFGQKSVSATRYLKREPVSESDLLSRRNELVAGLNNGITPAAPARTYRVPVTQVIEVQANDETAARRIALEELGLEEEPDVTVGAPQVSATTTTRTL